MKYEYYLDRAQVKESHERLKRAYRMADIDHAPIVERTVEPLGYTIYEIAYDEDKMLKQQLQDISLTMRHKTDYCPYLEPWHCVPIYAEAFGAKIRWFENEWPACVPIITDNPMDVYKMKPAKVWESELWKKLRVTIEHFKDCTNGDIPIATTDPQGPCSNATLLWQTDEFIVACITNPKEVHYFMNLLTDQFIEYYDAQLKIIDNPAFPGHAFPLGETGMGISISDDNAVMLSPAIYEEFCVPYYTRIAEHYNGIYIHSCGKFLHNLPSMLKIPKLRAINYHSGPREMDSTKARAVIDGKCAVWTGLSLPEAGFGGEMPPLENVFRDFYIPTNVHHGKKGLLISGFGSYYGTKNIAPEEQDQRYDWIVSLMEKNE